jgi:hypothetical protein
MKKEIVITFAPDGTVSAVAQGFKGTSCEKAIDKLMAGLGVTVDKKRTPDFYAKEEQHQKGGQ